MEGDGNVEGESTGGILISVLLGWFTLGGREVTLVDCNCIICSMSLCIMPSV